MFAAFAGKSSRAWAKVRPSCPAELVAWATSLRSKLASELLAKRGPSESRCRRRPPFLVPSEGLPRPWTSRGKTNTAAPSFPVVLIYPHHWSERGNGRLAPGEIRALRGDFLMKNIRKKRGGSALSRRRLQLPCFMNYRHSTTWLPVSWEWVIRRADHTVVNWRSATQRYQGSAQVQGTEHRSHPRD